MSRLFIIIAILIAGCSSSRKNNNADISPVVKPDSIIQPGVPACIKEKIREFQAAEKQNPPRQIYSYRYNGKTVYYITAPCCDFFSDLYDSSCVLIGHPDGGFTGK